MSTSNYALTNEFRLAASTTLAQDALTCIDTDGRLVAAADTADYRFAGQNQLRCVSDSSGLTTLGAIAEAEVQLQGALVCALTKGGTNPDKILDPVYALSSTAVQDATDATNDIYVGRILRFLNSKDPMDYKDDTEVTASCYVLVGFDSTVQ